MHKFALVTCCLTTLAFWLSSTAGAPESQLPRKGLGKQLAGRLGKFPIHFIENRGQLDSRVAYYVEGRNSAVAFTRDSIYYSLRKVRSSDRSAARNANFTPEPPSPAWTVQLELLNANPRLKLQAQDPAAAVVSYFRGSPEQWKTGLPTFSSVLYKEVWPGIDLEFAGPEGNLKYTFHVHPGADPKQIRFAYRGASSITLTPEGSLNIETPAGGFADDKPVAWQETETGRQPINTAFRLEGEDVRFDVGPYDSSRDLAIDPVVLIYSGFLGGSGYDQGYAIAVDAAGNAYVTGVSYSSTNFPTAAGPDLTHNGAVDVFVAKVNSTGTALLYSGFLGGSGDDYGFGIAADADGNAYVAGRARPGFPTTVGPALNGTGDAFVAKINSTGTALLYSRFLGGSIDGDEGRGIAVDATGNAYVTGGTDSTDFPAAIGPDATYNGGGDAFVAKINPSGTALVYAGYVGGSGGDGGEDIAVDSAGNAYVVGHTGSDENSFPVVVGPDITFNHDADPNTLDVDAFVTKISPSGTVVYSGYIGGASQDWGYGITVDAAGSAYITGSTFSTEATFPVTVGPDLTHNDVSWGTDAFVAKVNSVGSALVYAGYIGGNGEDVGFDIAVDSVGNAYVTGTTWSTQSTFPIPHSVDSASSGGSGTGSQTGGSKAELHIIPGACLPGSVSDGRTISGGADAFIAKRSATGGVLVYSRYLGGLYRDQSHGIAVDTAGSAYVIGEVSAVVDSDAPDCTTYFPTVMGPDTTHNGVSDSFITKLAAFPGTAGPNLAFRNGFNAIEMNTFPSPGLHNFGGIFRLNPAVAMSSSGRAFVVARDSAVGVWINFLKPDRTDNGSWIFAEGNSPGQPALAVTGETAWIAVRDPWNSYYVRSYTPGVGFGAWTWLQGILATTPQIAGCPNGDVYITGKDNWNGVWTRRYSANLAAWQNWLFIGGIITGGPAITCGSDNAAYIAARDPSNNMWLARVAQESSSSWHYGEGIFQDDLHIAAKGNLIHVVGLSSFVPWYRTWEVGTGWQGWTSPGGVLAHVAPAVYGNYLYLTGQTGNGNLWWWSSLSNSWTNFGTKNIAASSRFSAGAR